METREEKRREEKLRVRIVINEEQGEQGSKEEKSEEMRSEEMRRDERRSEEK